MLLALHGTSPLHRDVLLTLALFGCLPLPLTTARDLLAEFKWCADSAANESAYDSVHLGRYIKTFQFFSRSYPLKQLPLRVLELGANGDPSTRPVFGRCLQAALGGPQHGVLLDSYERDLRKPFVGVPSDFYDAVLCLEVIEHIHDLSPADRGDIESFPDEFEYSGMRSMLAEVRRVLRRDGGRLLLSTPNAASVHVMARLVRHRSPWFYPRHQRELTASDLGSLLLLEGLAGVPLLIDTELDDDNSLRLVSTLAGVPFGDHTEAALQQFLSGGVPGSDVLRGKFFLLLTGRSDELMMVEDERNLRDESLGMDGFKLMLGAYEVARRLLPSDVA